MIIPKILQYFSSQLEDQNSIESSLDQALVQLTKINSDTMQSNSSSELLDSCQAVVVSQSKSLALLRPHMSYIIANFSGIQYDEAPDGTIKEAQLCQCLPKIPDDVNINIQVSSVQFSCPEDHANKDNGGQEFEVACLSDQCPRVIENKCMQM